MKRWERGKKEYEDEAKGEYMRHPTLLCTLYWTPVSLPNCLQFVYKDKDVQ